MITDCKINKGIIFALLSAMLFGASTPFAKILLSDISPIMLAGLLYGGSGVGLLSWLLLQRLFFHNSNNQSGLTKQDLPWFSGAVIAGGVVAPVLLMFGITLIPASSAALLLNLEGVFTALLAWFVFKENFDKRIMLGMMYIIAAGTILSWQEGQNIGIPWGGILIAGACLCWGIDNNLTHKVSASNAVQIAGIKGLTGAIVNLSIAGFLGFSFPSLSNIVLAGIVGLAGYGMSLVFFVLELRGLGTARTGAYFSTAPFVGAAISLILLKDTPEISFWIAAALMMIGIWLHLTEKHEHEHTHSELTHNHKHIHDEHHQHKHDFEWDGKEPHSHIHTHENLTHSHAHYPDIHHRHSHS